MFKDLVTYFIFPVRDCELFQLFFGSWLLLVLVVIVIGFPYFEFRSLLSVY